MRGQSFLLLPDGPWAQRGRCEHPGLPAGHLAVGEARPRVQNGPLLPPGAGGQLLPAAPWLQPSERGPRVGAGAEPSTRCAPLPRSSLGMWVTVTFRGSWSKKTAEHTEPGQAVRKPRVRPHAHLPEERPLHVTGPGGRHATRRQNPSLTCKWGQLLT